MGFVLVLYPGDTLHEKPPRYWGISVDQFASAVCQLAGLAMLRQVSAGRAWSFRNQRTETPVVR